MIYSRFMINCDVSIRTITNGIQIYAIGKDVIIVSTVSEAIDTCMTLRTQGIQIPDYVIENLKNDL